MAQHHHDNTCGHKHNSVIGTAATDYEVAHAKNISVSLPTKTEMNLLINSYRDEVEEEISIGTFTFKNESRELVDRFVGLLSIKEDYRFGKSGIDEFQKNRFIDKNSIKELVNDENCDSVECAARAIWGENASKILFLNLKYGVNTSPVTLDPFKKRERKSQKWDEGDLDIIHHALRDVPDYLFPLNSFLDLNNDGQGDISSIDESFLEIAKKSYEDSPPGVAARANEPIELFYLWDQMTDLDKRYTLYHEFSHYVDKKLGRASFSREDDFRGNHAYSMSSEWLGTTSINVDNNGAFISSYAKSNQYEEFAESSTACRYNQDLLKELLPTHFETISKLLNEQKEVYQQEESGISAVTKDILDEVGRIIERIIDTMNSKSVSDFEHIYGQCQDYLSLNNNLELSDNYLRCVNELVAKEIIESKGILALINNMNLSLKPSERVRVFDLLQSSVIDKLKSQSNDIAKLLVNNKNTVYSSVNKIQNMNERFIERLMSDSYFVIEYAKRNDCPINKPGSHNCLKQQFIESLEKMNTNRCALDLRVGIDGKWSYEESEATFERVKESLEGGSEGVPVCMLYSGILKELMDPFEFEKTKFSTKDFSKIILNSIEESSISVGVFGEKLQEIISRESEYYDNAIANILTEKNNTKEKIVNSQLKEMEESLLESMLNNHYNDEHLKNEYFKNIRDIVLTDADIASLKVNHPSFEISFEKSFKEKINQEGNPYKALFNQKVSDLRSDYNEKLELFQKNAYGRRNVLKAKKVGAEKYCLSLFGHTSSTVVVDYIVDRCKVKTRLRSGKVRNLSKKDIADFVSEISL